MLISYSTAVPQSLVFSFNITFQPYKVCMNHINHNQLFCPGHIRIYQKHCICVQSLTGLFVLSRGKSTLLLAARRFPSGVSPTKYTDADHRDYYSYLLLGASLAAHCLTRKRFDLWRGATTEFTGVDQKSIWCGRGEDELPANNKSY